MKYTYELLLAAFVVGRYIFIRHLNNLSNFTELRCLVGIDGSENFLRFHFELSYAISNDCDDKTLQQMRAN